jgi:heme exporter protein B
MTSLGHATWLLLRKELLIELRTREIVVTTGLFATLVAVLASLSFYIDPESALRVAPGVLWTAIAFAGILAMGRSWAREREHDVIRGLLLSPVPRSAIYLSKAIGSCVFLFIVEAVLLVEIGVLYNIALTDVLGPLLLLVGLGTIGFCATGTLFAALSVKSRAREMMLAVTVFPVVTPALLCGVVGTRELLLGAPFSEITPWIALLGAFDLGLLATGIVLFDTLMGD